MRESDLQVDVLLAVVFGGDGRGGVFDAGAVSDADEAEDGGVAFAYAGDVVLEVGACGSWGRDC